MAGSFDLTRYQVLSDGTFAYLRVTLRTLVPTFGAMDGAQLLDVYVHVPGATATSTAAAFASRNYTIASSGAWSQRVEVQGFAAPVWVNATGGTVGTPFVLANGGRPHDHDRAARGAVRHPGLRVGLHGRADWPGRLPARSGSYVCPDTPTLPVRGVRSRRELVHLHVRPGAVPKAMDVITPAGVSQATELDPTLGPVVIQPVTVP